MMMNNNVHMVYNSYFIILFYVYILHLINLIFIIHKQNCILYLTDEFESLDWEFSDAL